MRFSFKNIGPINDAAMELGDLTIIAGPNNAGKTYLAYMLYGFLKDFPQNIPIQFAMRRDMIRHRSSEGTVINKESLLELLSKGKTTVPCGENLFRNQRAALMDRASRTFSDRLIHQNFSAPSQYLRGARLTVDVNSDAIPALVKKVLPAGFYRREFSRGSDMSAVYEDEKVKFSASPAKWRQYPTELAQAACHHLWDAIVYPTLPEPFILSAERFGVSLFYKELDFAKNRLVEELQKLSDEKRRNVSGFINLERESARYARPIKDNIDYIRDLDRVQKQRCEFADSGSGHADIRQMMGGYYRYQDGDIRFVATARKENRFNIPLHLASSSARGLTLLYFFLRYTAKDGQLLIIDEPESHLSPANQIAVARLLARCVKNGLKVLVTTHSDYFVKEINNLIMLSRDFPDKKDFLRRNRKDYSEADGLNPEVVRAYICDGGKLKPCGIDERGIDMPSFDDTIDKINRIAGELDDFLSCESDQGKK